MTKTLRIPFLALAALMLAFGSTAQADDFPPAKEDETQPSGASETPPAGWSPPATTPGRTARPTMNDPSLPPPRIVRRGGARSTTPRAPVNTPPSTNNPPISVTPRAPVSTPPTGTTNPPISVTPRTPRSTTPNAVPGTMMPPPPAQPRAPAGTTPPTTTMTPPATTQPRSPVQPTATATGTTGVAGSRIFNITKMHNVPLDRGPGTEQDLALQLDVDYEVRGQNGRDVYVGIWFANKETGTMVQAAVPSYRDRAGNATLQTRAGRVAGNAARYKATLRIPYAAFPMGPGQASYDVEARVQVLRSEGRGQVTVLCRGSTTFRVYGYEEGEEPAPPPAADDGIPNDVQRGEIVPGTSIPGEGGRISDPGR